jgi:hypothetical protein
MMNPSSQLIEPESPDATPEVETRPDLAAARALGQSEAPMKRNVMAFEAPYLLEKLRSTGLVDEPEQAQRLFEEVKKYLLLSQHLRKPLPMSSALVDATWHQFVLFTRQYENFCRSCLGTFCHHVPTNPVSEAPSDAGAEEVSHDEFVELYEACFGPLPHVWYDSECLRPETRLRHAAGSDAFSVGEEAEHAVLFRGAAAPELVCRVNARARGALMFIAAHPCFLVREIPGLRTLRECITLCRPLVRYGVLRVAV